jgi:Uma2 family endonuclease
LKVRKPDAAYISFTRLPQDQEPEGNCRVAPDIAVEVISPNDVFEDVTGKVEEYLAAGVPIVWVVDPQTRRILVYHRDGGRILTDKDELSGENVLPGFSCQVQAVFSA